MRNTTSRNIAQSGVLLFMSLALFGCSSGMPVNTITPVASPTAHALRGIAHGGQQPIQQGQIYLYAAGTNGYASASTSLLSGSNVVTDGNGNGYVVTDAGGNFNLTGDYTCPSSTSLVYVLLVGGNAGSGVNASTTLMAALGNCVALQANAANIFISLNEISTVAAVYALAPFMSSPTSIGAPGSNLAGITNAFAEVPNLVSLGLGMPYSTTPAGNGVVPAKLIDTVADFISICVNSNGLVTGGSTTNCDRVFSPTTVNSSAPSSTMAAVLATAQNPANNASSIVYSILPTAPFQPTLSIAPKDLTMSIAYSGGGISTPASIAIDATGNAWVASVNNAVTELSAGTGAALSGTTGYTSGSLDAPTSIAIDTSGNVWLSNCGGQCSGTANASSVTMLTPGSGNTVTAQNFTGGSLNGSYSIALDSNNRAWIANAFGASLSLFTSAGNQSGTTGYTATFQSNPAAVAVDMGADTWAVSPSTNAIVEFDSNGNAGGNSYQGPGMVYPVAVAVDSANRPWAVNETTNALTQMNGNNPATPFTGGGLSSPNAIAFDGVSSAWVTNGNGTVSAFSYNGTALTPSTGYIPGAAFANSIAVDASGNVWLTSCGSYCTGTGSDPGSVYQMIGVAAPVVTPLSVGSQNGTLAARP